MSNLPSFTQNTTTCVIENPIDFPYLPQLNFLVAHTCNTVLYLIQK